MDKMQRIIIVVVVVVIAVDVNINKIAIGTIISFNKDTSLLLLFSFFDDLQNII